MTRNSFDLKLQLMHQELVDMSRLVEQQISSSVLALKNQDENLAMEVIEKDDEVDKFERDIEEKCVRMIAMEQPLAGDLRRIFVTSKIVTDLERMADHAVDIARIAILLKDETYIKELVYIPKMAQIVEKMVKGAVEVYITRNTKLAYEICDMDNEVDTIYDSVFQFLLEKMRTDEKAVTQGSRFLFVCKYLERIADHGTNICEDAVYLETGEKLKLN